MTTQPENRKKFLLELYNQLWNSINARINVSWQSIGILVSSFAIMALAEKQIISLSFSSAIIVLLVAWFLAHLIDISFWYNRNQTIISNIEREFLNKDDTKLIHPYFLSHRENNKMVKFLKIQSFLGLGIGLVVLIVDFNNSVLPIIISDYKRMNIVALLPYLITFLSIGYLIDFSQERNKDYKEFLEISSGKQFD